MKTPLKRIGLIGGLSPESTIHYYKLLCEEYNRGAGGLNFPGMVIDTLNLQQLVDLFARDDWDQVAALLLASLARLKAAGAEFAAILANTPHNAYDLLREKSPLPIVTIMEATASALASAGVRRAGLLGTKATMEFGFFQKHFATHGIEVCTPTPAQRQRLDRIIWDELSHGKVLAASKKAARTMIAGLQRQGAEAVVLGCTELGLLIDSGDTPLPLYDTLRLHALSILAFASRSEASDGQAAGPPSRLASPTCYLDDFPDW